MRFFDKKPYEAEPSDHIRKVIERLGRLGKAVMAVRGPGFSANILGTLYLGTDGDDPVLRGKKEEIDECTCNIHVMWDKIHVYVLEHEDVGYGPEPVVYLIDESGEPIINVFFPGVTFEEIQALFAAPSAPDRIVPSRPFRFVFMVRFESEADMKAYIEFWEQMSPLIQQEAGARGTRLHRVKGEEFAVLAIAEWDSEKARVDAYAAIANKYPPDHRIHLQPDKFGGKLSIIGEADEIGRVMP